MFWRLVLAICIIITFTIGFGVIALPILVGLAGFWPGVVACFVTGVYTLVTALLYLEATLIFPGGANVATISNSLLGPTGTVIASVSFIYVHACFLIICYLFGVPLITEITRNYFDIHLPLWVPYMGILLIFGGLVYSGMIWSARLIFLFTCGFICLMIYVFLGGSKYVIVDHFSHANWLYILFTIPSMYNSFFFHSIIPSLATFLKRDWVQLKRAIWISTTLVFLFFVSWLWLTVGLTTDLTLTTSFESGQPLLEGIRVLNETLYIGKATLSAALFTLSASILVMGIANVDFYADLFGLPLEKRKGLNRLLICILFFLPPFILSLLTKLNIMVLLNATTGFSLIISGAILPLIWILSARYIQKREYPHRLKLNRTAFILLILATFGYIYLEGILLIELNIA